jgi:hypothetical protein
VATSGAAIRASSIALAIAEAGRGEAGHGEAGHGEAGHDEAGHGGAGRDERAARSGYGARTVENVLGEHPAQQVSDTVAP